MLKALPGGRWAHFACHALSDLERPFLSGLVLGDAHLLSVKDLMKLDLRNVELAFLSACSTARPGTPILEEVVHLASAFRLAGYAHIVATLWPVGDRAAAYVSEQFYRKLCESGNSTGTAAAALHSAVRQLRERLSEQPSRWAAHIHVGS